MPDTHVRAPHCGGAGGAGVRQGSRLYTCLGPETEAGSLAGLVHDCGWELAVA